MPSRSNRKKIVWAIVAAGVMAVVAVFVWGRQPADLRTALARALNRDKDQIFLNIPPFDGRYPGTLLFTPEPGVTITRVKEYHPDYIPAAVSSIRVHLGEQDKALLSGKAFGLLSSSADLDIVLQLDSLRLFEINLDSSLKAKALQYSDLLKDPQKNPVFVYRSYEAIPILQVHKSSKLDAKAWQEVKKNSLEAGASLNADGEITFRNAMPVVVAYEVVKADLLSSSLSAGAPDKVNFTQVLSPTATYKKPDAATAGLVPASASVRYVCAGNAVYKSKAFANLNFVKPSIETVSDVFSNTGATALFPIDAKNGALPTTSLEDLIQKSVSQMKTSKDSLLVFYYVGHAISGPGGQLYLVLNDYKGDPKEDLGEESALGLFRHQMQQPTHPLSHSNFADLLDISNAMQADFPKQVPGLYPVSTLYKQLYAIGKPFVVLIDACYDHSQMKQLQKELHLSDHGDYFGPSQSGGPQELLDYKQAIADFGIAPYLNKENVVIFSAAPGSIALEVADPRPHFGAPSFVAPLARRLSDAMDGTLADGEPVTWGNYLQPIVDVKKTGEIQIKGTVSWSDFTLLKKMPLFR